MTRAKTGLRLLPWLLLFVLFLAAARFTGCSPALFWARRSHLSDVFVRMIPPDWAYFPRIFPLLWATVQMSVAGTVLGAFFALLAAPFCSANLKNPSPLRVGMRVLIQILRSFPTLILALAATFLFGIGCFAGAVAITLYTFAIMTRLCYEDIETADIRPYLALCSMGVSPGKAYFRAVLPEIASSYLANALYLLETNVRHSAILGYVGAGGIGLLLNEKISWKEYDRVGAILLALFAAVCLIEWISERLTLLVRGEKTAHPAAVRAILAALALLFVLSLVTVGRPDFSRTSIQTVGSMFSGLVWPEWGFLVEGGSGGLPWLLLETVCIAFVGTVIGALLSLPLAVLGTSRLVPELVALFFRLFVMALRSIPFLIYGIIFIRVAGPGAFTGVLTMAVCSIGLITKRFTEAIDSLDFRPYRALGAMGISPLLRVRYAVLPQLIPAFASAVLYRFDVNTREASVLGVVGAGGIGAPLIFAMNHYAWRRAGAITLGLILLVWLVDLISARLRGGRRR